MCHIGLGPKLAGRCAFLLSTYSPSFFSNAAVVSCTTKPYITLEFFSLFLFFSFLFFFLRRNYTKARPKKSILALLSNV